MSVKGLSLSVILILALILAGCGFGPPPSCGDTIGGTADTARFDQYFTSMQLVSQGTGQPGPEGENGAQFSSGDVLEIRTEGKSEGAVRACVQPRGPGDIAYDQTLTLPEGAGVFVVGSYQPGIYVIRVIVEGVLVKNFAFEIK